MAVLQGWLIRGLILTVLLGGGGFAVGLSSRAGPDQVRAALIAELEARLTDTEVHVGAAKLRWFAGVTVTDLQLTRKGESIPFFSAKSAVIYHDKRTLSRGKMEIRKIEFDSPTLRLERREDGTLNVSGIAKPGPSGDPVPTILVSNATVFVTDRQPGGPPPVVVTDARLTLINDPQSVLKLDFHAVFSPATADGAEPTLRVPLSASARVYRPNGHTTARVEIPDVPFTPDLAPALAKIDPMAADLASQFSARLGVKINILADPDAPNPLSYDVAVDVRDGRFEEPQLPWPVEQITAAVRMKDGKLSVDRGRAKFGKANIELGLETSTVSRPEPTAPVSSPAKPREYPSDALGPLQNHLDRFDLTVHNLPLDDDLFAKLIQLTPKAEKARRMFSPAGGLDIAVGFRRTGPTWERKVELRPNRLSILYEKFPYPVSELSGSVTHTVTHDGTDEFQVEVIGTAGGRRIDARGIVSGDGPDPKIRLRLSGTDLPIDDSLINAMPPNSGRALRKLRASGRGDFVADIRQEHGVNRCDNTFRVHVYGGTVNYTHFPYTLTEVKGDILIRATATAEDRPLKPGLPIKPMEDTDRVELRNFEAAHNGGRVWLSGENEPVSGTPDRKMTLRVQGLDCPADNDFRAALTAVRLEPVVRTFQPRGSLTFGADMEMIDRNGSVPSPPTPAPPKLLAGLVAPVAAVLPAEPPFDPVADLKMTMNFKGLGVTPDFFSYSLDDLGGVMRYQGGKLDLTRFAGRHGESRWGLEAAEVRFADGGEVWANLGRLTASPLVPDAQFMDALPGKLKNGVKDLNPRGPMELVMSHLVVKVPPDAAVGRAESSRPDVDGVGPRRLGPTYEITPDPIVFWNGELRLSGAGLDAGVPWDDMYGVVATTGRYEGNHLGPVAGNIWLDKASVARQPVTGAKLSYRVRPQQPDASQKDGFTPPVLEVPDIAGSLFQGAVGGEARVEFADDMRYRLWLTASDVRLEDLAAHVGLGSGAELRGRAQAKLVVETVPDPTTGRMVLAGAGQVDVPGGRMYNLPVMLPLLKLLKLQAPDQTAFEEAHAAFDLRGDRVTVTQLDLIGTAVSLGGSGEVDTSGENARFEFYPVLSQALKKWLVTPGGVDLTAALNGSLFKIEVNRKDGHNQYKAHMLPAVTDPLRAVAERLRVQVGRRTDPAELPTTVRATVGR